jgi:hypothetical protein
LILTFMSVIHFELIWWLIDVCFHSSACVYPGFPAPFIKRMWFYLMSVLGSVVDNLLYVMHGYILGFLSVPLVGVPVFMLVSCCFNYCFIVYFEVR